jgi:RNA polymerase sigma-70 factor (ECF subfamily)
MHSTPVSLLERLRRPDDADAWARFVHLYAPTLYGWARRLGMQEADAADFVQDVFGQMLRRLPDFHYDPAFRFRAWLRTVALNLWRDRLKRRPVPVPAGAAAALDGQPALDDLERLIETEHNARLVRRALDILEADFQPATWRAFWQVTIDERPAADVGRDLGLSVAAVYAAKCRVLARLRRELAGLYP